MILTAAEIAALKNEINTMIAGNPAIIVIRRDGSADLAAQTVRVERGRGGGGGNQGRDSMGMQTAGRVIVLGTTALDIQAGDRFTTGGSLYRVIFVRPNQQIAIQAEAEMIQ